MTPPTAQKGRFSLKSALQDSPDPKISVSRTHGPKHTPKRRPRQNDGPENRPLSAPLCVDFLTFPNFHWKYSRNKAVAGWKVFLESLQCTSGNPGKAQLAARRGARRGGPPHHVGLQPLGRRGVPPREGRGGGGAAAGGGARAGLSTRRAARRLALHGWLDGR